MAVAIGLAPRLAHAEQNDGLRFLGDARLAVGTTGGVVGGPALRFRYGGRFIRRPVADTPADWLVGSWVGVEVSAGLLVGATEPGDFGAITLFGLRPWLSRQQSDWFLRTERFSVLGALLPEVGIAFGLPERIHVWPRPYLGWDLALGGKHLHVVPGIVWIIPPKREELPIYVTLALRVPM